MNTLNPVGIRLRDYRVDDLPRCLEVFETNVPRFFRAGERDEYRRFLESLLRWGMIREDMHGTGLGRRLRRGVGNQLGHRGTEGDVRA